MHCHVACKENHGVEQSPISDGLKILLALGCSSLYACYFQEFVILFPKPYRSLHFQETLTLCFC